MNVGVMAVATALSGSAAGLGLGLGLFGVLSIIRLRSTELAQHEVAYYFSALALGLIAGLGIEPAVAAAGPDGPDPAGDVRRVTTPGSCRPTGTRPSSWTAPSPRTVNCYARLEDVLHGKVHSATVQELDLVNDKTIVDVRYAYTPAASAPASAFDPCQPRHLTDSGNRTGSDLPAAGSSHRSTGRCGMNAGLSAAASGTAAGRGAGRTEHRGGAADQGGPQIRDPRQPGQAAPGHLRRRRSGSWRWTDCRTFDYDSVYFDTAPAGQLPAGGPGAGAAATRSAPGPTWTAPSASWRSKPKAAARPRSRNASPMTWRTGAGSPPRASPTSTTPSPPPSATSRPVRWSRSWKPATAAPRCSCPDPAAAPPSTRRSPGSARAASPGSSTGRVVLETKSGSAAGPLDRHLWAHGIRPSRISKFATGMAALRPELPANRWHRTLRRSLS